MSQIRPSVCKHRHFTPRGLRQVLGLSGCETQRCLFEGIQKGWALRVRRQEADPDDILDISVSFPGAAAGAE